jgi:hypothetical protein
MGKYFYLRQNQHKKNKIIYYIFKRKRETLIENGGGGWSNARAKEEIGSILDLVSPTYTKLAHGQLHNLLIVVFCSQCNAFALQILVGVSKSGNCKCNCPCHLPQDYGSFGKDKLHCNFN